MTGPHRERSGSGVRGDTEGPYGFGSLVSWVSGPVDARTGRHGGPDQRPGRDTKQIGHPVSVSRGWQASALRSRTAAWPDGGVSSSRTLKSLLAVGGPQEPIRYGAQSHGESAGARRVLGRLRVPVRGSGIGWGVVGVSGPVSRALWDVVTSREGRLCIAAEGVGSLLRGIAEEAGEVSDAAGQVRKNAMGLQRLSEARVRRAKTLWHIERLPRTQARSEPEPLRRPHLAGLASPRHPRHHRPGSLTLRLLDPKAQMPA